MQPISLEIANLSPDEHLENCYKMLALLPYKNYSEVDHLLLSSKRLPRRKMQVTPKLDYTYDNFDIRTSIKIPSSYFSIVMVWRIKKRHRLKKIRGPSYTLLPSL
jgi:hypothetical protein